MRGTVRQYIQTRSGVSEIRVERRAIGANVATVFPNVSPMEYAPIENNGKSSAIVPCDIRQCLTLADDVARQLRNRIAFPAEFWKGAIE